MELINALGLNVKILLAQLVNFSVLLFVLYKFAYGPILKMLDERRDKIEEGIKNAEDAKTKLAKIEMSEKEILSDARKEAQKIIVAAEDVAKKNKEDILNEAKKQSQQILEKAEKNIEQEKNKMMEDAKKELSELVSLATEKIVGEKMDAKKDKEIIDSVIK
ncbi:MAG: F0F1 ATP synthase subunit B [Candidatus Moranbacteria bacterium]|nr:F0F1 ATP synthase subunit B [Candidatus Moranbacteria bacterium]